MKVEFVSTVSSKGQTTVPKEIRDRLHLAQGQQVHWVLEVESGEVKLSRPAGNENPFLAAVGAFPLPDSLTTEQFMTELRGEPDPELQNGPGAILVTLEELRSGRL